MLTLRQRLALIIGSIVLVIVLAILGIWWSRRPKPVTQTPVQTATSTTELPEKPPALSDEVPRFGDTPITAPKDDNAEERYVRQLAGIFVERFATYSNQNDNRHLRDVEPISTASLMEWVSRQGLAASSTYQGVSAQVLSTTLVKRDGDTATVTVGVQETVSQAGQADQLRQRTGRVDLVKINGAWRVNAFYWDK